MSEATPFLDESTLYDALIASSGRLERYVASRLPATLTSVISPDDVLQEVWTAAFKGAAAFEPGLPNALERWIITIVNHKIADEIARATCLKRGGLNRALQRPRDIDNSLTDLFAALASTGQSPSRSCSAKESAQAVRIALGSLTEDYRRVVWLYEIQGHPVAEIARREDKTECAIRGILVRARKQMREHLGAAAKFFSDAGSHVVES